MGLWGCGVGSSGQGPYYDVPAEAAWETMNGYSFMSSPASVMSTGSEAMLQVINLASRQAAIQSGSSSYVAFVDSAAAAAGEEPVYEPYESFVVSTDSLFREMVARGSYNHRVPDPSEDSTVTAIDFTQSFAVVVYAPSAMMTGQKFYFTLQDPVVDDNTLYTRVEATALAPSEADQYLGSFWQVGLFKGKRGNFNRVGIINASDTLYYSLDAKP